MYFPTLPQDETEKFIVVEFMATEITPDDIPAMFEYVTHLDSQDYVYGILLVREYHRLTGPCSRPNGLSNNPLWVTWYREHAKYFRYEDDGSLKPPAQAWHDLQLRFDAFKKGEK